MTGEGTGERPAYVPADTLRALVDDFTVADVKLARAAYPEGDPMRGFATVYYAAKRTGVADAGESEEDFLARVRIVDLTPLLARATATLPEGPSGTSSSLTSAASGE